jgi:hypothetical protein
LPKKLVPFSNLSSPPAAKSLWKPVLVRRNL